MMTVQNNMQAAKGAGANSQDAQEAAIVEHETALTAARTALLSGVRNSHQAQMRFFLWGGCLTTALIVSTFWLVMALPSGLDTKSFWRHVLTYVTMCVTFALIGLKCYFASQRAAECLSDAYFKYGELTRSGPRAAGQTL